MTANAEHDGESPKRQRAEEREPNAKGTKQFLPIEEITIDAGTQARAVIDEAIVDEYADQLTEGATFPPVTVFQDGSTTYLADGFHRLEAHRRAGRAEIEAEVQAGTREDALWFALGANGTHGHRLTAADKKHAIELALEVWPDRSQRRIAAQIGCSQRYVGKVRGQVRTSSHLADRTVGTDGKSYPAGGNTPAAASREQDDEPENGTEAGETPAPVEADETKEETGKTERKGSPSQRAQNRSNKIVSVVARDALNLTAQEDLIDFHAIDHEKLPEWIGELEEARRRLGRLIRRLKQEVGDENGNDET